MRLRLMQTAATVALAGLTACAVPVSDAALCQEQVPLANQARSVLLDNASEVPDAVGEAITPLIVAIYVGCGK